MIGIRKQYMKIRSKPSLPPVYAYKIYVYLTRNRKIWPTRSHTHAILWIEVNLAVACIVFTLNLREFCSYSHQIWSLYFRFFFLLRFIFLFMWWSWWLLFILSIGVPFFLKSPNGLSLIAGPFLCKRLKYS